MSVKFERDYTIHLRVQGMVVGPLTQAVLDEFDERVRNAVEWSSAREALDHAVSESANGELHNFYVVDAVRPEGGIE